MICIPSVELVVVITLTLQGNGVRNQISEGVWDSGILKSYSYGLYLFIMIFMAIYKVSGGSLY